MRMCPECSKEYQEDIHYCGECGARLLRSQVRPCSKCGIANDLGSRYCKACGEPLTPAAVLHRKPDAIIVKRKADTAPNQPAPIASEPEMPEWLTRFSISQSKLSEPDRPPENESTAQLMNLLCQIWGISPDEIDAVQIRKKDGATIDLPAEPVERVEVRRRDQAQKK